MTAVEPCSGVWLCAGDLAGAGVRYLRAVRGHVEVCVCTHPVRADCRSLQPIDHKPYAITPHNESQGTWLACDASGLYVAAVCTHPVRAVSTLSLWEAGTGEFAHQGRMTLESPESAFCPG